MQSEQIRRQFHEYFKKHQHSVITSSSVVPHDDPTLLFTNAGMNQFKDVFLGKTKRDYTRASTSQKCIRVGGKHNDLDNVGHTSRHLTFFEMLGNFSFGDYFKEEAIRFAWEISTQVYGFEPERIWPTVFREDDEAFEMWTKYVPAERITRFDEKDNFWAMGDTGPCGPCSELLFDRGPEYGDAKKPSEDTTGERYLEYWNLVFMQYNRSLDGVMNPLPAPSIDTGAGLERVVSLKMGVDSVFETDILRNLIAQVEQVSGIPYHHHDETKAPAFRVIADHLRCLAFAISDGAQPSNIERGYVLRKILRRAVRYGRTLGMEDPFLAKILPRLIDIMGRDYPELKKNENRIAEILTLEEEAFIRTLRRGGNILNQVIDHAQSHNKIISGDEAFKLKDTYGFPFEEILLLAKDAGLAVDSNRYQVLEKEAKERSRNVHKVTHEVAGQSQFADFIDKHGPNKFEGYSQTTSYSKVIGLVFNGEFVDTLRVGEEGIVLLDRTPFYAEMGGQVGDTGELENDKIFFSVTDCQTPYKGATAHIGMLEQGELHVGDSVKAMINIKRRQKIANNHTATHLLHWALHRVLGEHVKQAGSVVEPGRLRFDFSHHKALTKEEIETIEDIVNAKIRENRQVDSYTLSYDMAMKREDIKQFFGDKYGSEVRVIDIEYSKELCGGTHTSSVGNIGLFRIAKESSIAAGVRRIEAVTGEEAESIHRHNEETLHSLGDILKTQPTKLIERVEKLLEENKDLLQEVKTAKKAQLQTFLQTLISQIEKLNSFSILTAEVPLSQEDMRASADDMIGKISSLVLALACHYDNKCHVVVRVSDDLVKKGVQANDIVKLIEPLIEGKGGGRPNNAQAGGNAPQQIPQAFSKIREFVLNKLTA